MNVALHFDTADAKSLFDNEKTMTNLSELNTPIRVIPQDSRISYPLNTAMMLFADPRLSILKVGVSYFDVDGGHYYVDQIIDVTELEQQSAHKAPIASMASSLERVEKTLSKLGNSNNPLRVISQDKAAHQKEQQEAYDAHRAKRAQTTKE